MKGELDAEYDWLMDELHNAIEEEARLSSVALQRPDELDAAQARVRRLRRRLEDLLHKLLVMSRPG